MAGHQFTPGLRNTSMMVGMSTLDYDVVVVGAGNGGLSAAALLKRRGCRDVALVEPSPVHVYKPLQNYVGVGLGEISELERFQADLIPAGVRWYQTSATRVDPANDSVHCADGTIGERSRSAACARCEDQLGRHTRCSGWTAGRTGMHNLPVGPTGPHLRDDRLAAVGPGGVHVARPARLRSRDRTETAVPCLRRLAAP